MQLTATCPDRVGLEDDVIDIVLRVGRPDCLVGIPRSQAVSTLSQYVSYRDRELVVSLDTDSSNDNPTIFHYLINEICWTMCPGDYMVVEGEESGPYHLTHCGIRLK